MRLYYIKLEKIVLDNNFNNLVTIQIVFKFRNKLKNKTLFHKDQDFFYTMIFKIFLSIQIYLSKIFTFVITT